MRYTTNQHTTIRSLLDQLQDCKERTFDIDETKEKFTITKNAARNKRKRRS